MTHVESAQAVVEIGNHTVALGPATVHKIKNETERQEIAKGPGAPAVLKIPETGAPHASQLAPKEAPADSKTPEAGVALSL